MSKRWWWEGQENEKKQKRRKKQTPFVRPNRIGLSTALPTSDRVVNGTPLHLFYDFLYELWSDWLRLLQPSIPIFHQHGLRSAEQGFWWRHEIHVGTRRTVTKNDLCVWRRRSLPTSCLRFRVLSKIVDVVVKVVYV